MPPLRARSTLSVSSWRTTRPRLAPSAKSARLVGNCIAITAAKARLRHDAARDHRLLQRLRGEGGKLMCAKRVPLPGIKSYGGIDLEQVKLDRVGYFDKRNTAIPQELPCCIEGFSHGCILHPSPSLVCPRAFCPHCFVLVFFWPLSMQESPRSAKCRCSAGVADRQRREKYLRTSDDLLA